MKCRSISASPPLRLTNYNLSSIPKTLKNNSIQDKPLDPNGDQNAFFANGESPLIGMMTVINNLHTSTSSQIIRQIRPQVQLNDRTTVSQQQQQQKQLEEKMIQGLAHELKTYPPRH
jgi:hypothetical protein